MQVLTDQINKLSDQYEKLENQFEKALENERLIEENNIKNLKDINKLLQFLQEKNLSYWFDNWYIDTLFFRVYGDRYSIV
jgi:ferritin